MHASLPSRLPVSSVLLGALSTFSVGWLAYYATQDTIRRITIRTRRKKYPLQLRTTGLLPHKKETNNTTINSPTIIASASSSWHGGANLKESESIKNRLAPLRILRRYVNPFPEWRETGVWEFIYYKLVHSMLDTPRRIAWDGGLGADKKTKEGMEKIERLLPVQPLDKVRLWGSNKQQPCADAEDMTYTWIGQSTTLIQMNGINILTDPVFGLQPIESIFSPTRMTRIPCTIEELTKDGKIDLVLISHNHFDHLDLTILPHFSKETQWIVPKGVSRLLIKNGIDAVNITELAWWEKSNREMQLSARKDEKIVSVKRNLDITAAPSMHWTGRNLFDVNQSLWCSYVIRVGSPESESKSAKLKSRSFFFCCDTGYSPLTFSSIGRALGPVDAAAIPIGSYSPRWFMSIQHGDPNDALHIAADIGSKQNFATHWGTWSMSDERWDDPISDLRAALEKEKLPSDFLVTLPFGKTVQIK